MTTSSINASKNVTKIKNNTKYSSYIDKILYTYDFKIYLDLDLAAQILWEDNSMNKWEFIYLILW